MRGDALAEDDVDGEAEGTAHGDGVTLERGRAVSHAGGRGEHDDA